MKKIIGIILVILIFVLFGFFMSGCRVPVNENGNKIISCGLKTFEEVDYAEQPIINGEISSYIIVYRDIDTDVLYLLIGSEKSKGITPMLNQDGTPQLYSEIYKTYK